jgi:hypothetical protein
MTNQATTQQVFDILRDTKNYITQIDHCYPEALHPNDREEIEKSSDWFRNNISLADVEEEMEYWATHFSEMPAEEQPLLIACHIMDSNADHGVYNTVSVYLTPIEQLNQQTL